MPQSITSYLSTASPSSRSRSSSISSTCSSSSFSSTYSSSSSYSLSSYGSSIRSPSESSDYSTSSTISSPQSKYAKRTEPISTLFAGLTFFFDKESFKSLNEKQKIVSLVKDHSASISLMLSKKTTHFIVDRPTTLLLSLADNSTSSTITHSLLFQINSAIRLNVQVASFDFVFASILQLTLATQHVATFTREIKVLAPEIPLIATDSYDLPNKSPSVTEEFNIPEDSVIGEEETKPDTTTDVAPSDPEDAIPVQPKPLEPLACVPCALAPSAPSFSPIMVPEDKINCRIMSQIEQTESLSYSFEESRYYGTVQGGGPIILGLPVREESKLGSLWGWGNNAKGQLGFGDRQRRMQPSFVSTDFASPLSQVACGDHHTAVVTASGDVWTWGSGSSGCLGHGEFKSSPDPMLVELFVSIKVTMVACGKSHTAALTDVGIIWTWGRNNVGQLGFSNTDKYSQPQEVFSIKNAVFVACAGNNTAVLNKFGDLYTMGSNVHGQRGLGKQLKQGISSPSRVYFPDNAKVKYTTIGQGFMGALGTDGALYMWGRNLENQCGNGSATDVFSPQKIPTSAPVIHLACGDTHAAYVNEKGEVFTWGWGPFGQLGHPISTQTVTQPMQVENIDSARMVACGSRHTLVISGERDKIWAWGSNESGQMGVPSFDSYDEYEVDEDEEYSDDEEDFEHVESSGTGVKWLRPQVLESMSRCSMIACGKDCTLAIIEESHVPIQFAKDGDNEALCYWLENNPKMRDLDQDSLRAELSNIRDDELGSDYSLLHWATYFANEDVLELLAGKWMDSNITDSNGDTPLHVCAERDLPFCAQILLQTGGKPDWKNKKGKTPIHVCVENHANDVLREFVENSISDKSVVDEIGNTPLHYAIQLRHFDMAKYLIERAAQPQILDKSGKTALDYCSLKEASYFKSIAQKNDVFISYAHVDLTFALKIKEFLEAYSIKCWMDMTRLEAGSDWRLDIGNGLLSSRLVLYVGSRASVVSDWCIKELHMAKRHNLTIIPVWHQKVEFDSEVRSLIFGRGFLDFSKPQDFEKRGKRLSKKLKYVLDIIKQAKPNPYLEIPVLTTEQLWKQLFLTILIESHTCIDAAGTLERVLHSSAIFSCTHNISLPPTSPYFSARQENLDHSWGIVFLINNLKQAGPDIEKWWKYAEDNGKRVYLCMVRGDATHVKTEDLPTQALKQTSVPIFYLENTTSLQQLVFFVHLAQREEFMAKQVGVMEDKLSTAITSIRSNDQELLSLRKRFYVE